MKKLLKLFTNKILITAFSFLVQLAFIAVIVVFLSAISLWLYAFLGVLSVLVCLYINSLDVNPSFKLAWVIPILIFPLFGGTMYLLMGRTPKLKRKIRRRMALVARQTQVALSKRALTKEQSDKVLVADQKKVQNFINLNSGFPLYDCTQTTYYKSGEEYYESLLQELKKAEKFIFLEFFIIERGKFWNSILEVLQQKVSEGVDVRVLYDDVGCLFTLPSKYYKTLRNMGIKAQVFNKVKLSFSAQLNNRTHRKIVVIDGKTAFTGGINIADEYINEIKKFGHWKDTGMMFVGNGAWSFTMMFLRFWHLVGDDMHDYEVFAPPAEIPAADGYVQPLSGGPGIYTQIIENTMIQMIANANDYVYINTPYLIIDNEFATALCNAAKSGIDVRITVPHIPDKKTVFIMTRSFYPLLTKAGVKIYEYLPGFVHAKSIVCDDSLAYIGTCNLDYRSFYLHYECGAILYNNKSILDMKNDYLKTLELCKEITYQEANDVNIVTRIARSVLRLFAPLM